MAGRRGRRGRTWRWLRWPVLALALIIAVPVVLTPVYLFVQPISVPMLTRMISGQTVVREWRDLDKISDRLKVSVIMSEDGQFCRHWGVDVAALSDEIDGFLAGREVRGASTLTMQVARNLFLWNDRSIVRKALEVPLAIYIDLVMPKQRIFEIYLNIAEWGPAGQFGVEAGAQAAFGTGAGSFTWERAALLTTALPNPHVRLPASPNAGLRRVAAIIEDRARLYSDRTLCVFEGPPEL